MCSNLFKCPIGLLKREYDFKLCGTHLAVSLEPQFTIIPHMLILVYDIEGETLTDMLVLRNG